MRIRISSSSPLPDIKAWFSLGRDDGTFSIFALKEKLCATVHALREARVPEHEIALLLDGFELLDESSVDVLREGDLVCIRPRASSAKRKASVVEEPPRKKARPAVPVNPPRSDPPLALHTARALETSRKPLPGSLPAKPANGASSSASSDSSSSSDDTSSSDPDSDSDSSSESDSDSSSSSSSNTSPAVMRSKPLPKPSEPNTPHVPPGHGKPQTQSRNLRRRLKRQHERDAAILGPSASANATPLGTKHQNPPKTASAPPKEAEPSIAMMSLSNKNKRRGFKRAMAGQLPTRIAFSDDATPSSSSVVDPTSSRPASPAKLPRLIPPSEKQDLGLIPPNVFVTSVDVEAGLWPQKKKKGKQREEGVSTDVDPGPIQAKQWDWKEKKRQRNGYGQEDGAWGGDHAGVNIHLPYDEEAAAAMSHADALDWDAVEKSWATLQTVTPASSLSPGCVVGWKELGIHPVTLTPELLLKLATVVGSETGQVKVKVLARPGTDLSSFAVADEGASDEEIIYGEVASAQQLIAEVSDYRCRQSTRQLYMHQREGTRM
ncbi:hypothetical protein BV25DRAFT_1970353 [Artomyces pyxidatus]|uniref:Uncharacterized protein n=1 Tax=Artomyces pyxidatus TaxID=48021 RepID=A0ACB8SNR6_9AGAM|nr:hypothetical protein BV25DRAFT_1970353 [Artomyces pyxidatus]